MSHSWQLRAIRFLQAVVAVALSIAVFGICGPFTLIALRALPNHGLANIVYVGLGAVAGLVVGALGVARTLRGPALWPRSFVWFVSGLSLVVVSALFAASTFDAFAHV